MLTAEAQNVGTVGQIEKPACATGSLRFEKDISMKMKNRGRSDYHDDDGGSGAAPRSRDGLV